MFEKVLNLGKSGSEIAHAGLSAAGAGNMDQVMLGYDLHLCSYGPCNLAITLRLLRTTSAIDQ